MTKEELATLLAPKVRYVLGELEDWQKQHPEVADYRVTGPIGDLSQALKHLDALSRGEHTAEWRAALAMWKERHPLDADDEPAEPEQATRNQPDRNPREEQ